jgi:hypothetical protein
MFIAGAKSLWYGLTFPVRALAAVGSLLLPHEAVAPEQKNHDVGLTIEDKSARREPFKGEAIEELHDALSPAYDQLRLARMWWFLEWMPLKHKKGNAVFRSSNDSSDYHWLFVLPTSSPPTY